MSNPRTPLRRACLAALSAAAILTLGAGQVAAAFEIQPEARLHLDYAHHDSDARHLANGGIVRRATAGLKGKFNTDWSFEAAYEFASDGRLRPGDGEFKDLALTYKGWSAAELAVGQFKIPFGLAELTSSSDMPFIERALPVDAFAPSRRLAIGASRERDAYTLTGAVFGSAIDGGNRGRGAAARLTLAPIRSERSLLHFGLAAASEKPRGKVDFDTAPESRVADVDLVNTGRIDGARRIDRLGLEAAWRSGPFTAQAEWLRASVRRDGEPRADFDGWYVAGAWVLTGETRRYKDGRFKGIEPSRKTGAWELTARLSRIDLDGAGVRGGRQRNLTLGVNYTFNDHLRIMLNHIRVHSQRRGERDAPNIWLLRVQVAL